MKLNDDEEIDLFRSDDASAEKIAGRGQVRNELRTSLNILVSNDNNCHMTFLHFQEHFNFSTVDFEANSAHRLS